MKKRSALFISVLITSLLLTGCGTVVIGLESDAVLGMNREDVVSKLSDAGFKNITEKKVETFYKNSDGDVLSITIDGTEYFHETDTFPAGANVKVSYFVYREPTAAEKAQLYGYGTAVTDPVEAPPAAADAQSPDSPAGPEAPQNTAVNDPGSPDGESLRQIAAIGDVNAKKGIFNVTLNIPKEYIGDTTQEKLDEAVSTKGYKSAKLNSDGSVTYVMSKSKHRELLKEIAATIDQALSDMAGSPEYPKISSVKANDDYTLFTVTTKNDAPDLAETLSVFSLYVYGGMYAHFNGEPVDNIHVDFVNIYSKEIIGSADSKNISSE